jgi:hypothetical protein
MINPGERRVQVSFLFAVFLFVALPYAGNSAVRFDVVGSPTEVINTGRSEVLGSINLIVHGTGSVTGTSAGGVTQIGFIFDHPALQIDNDGTSGILLFSSPGFAAANPTLIGIENRQIGGKCLGFLTLTLLPGATPAEGDFIRIDGIRGRIDASEAVMPGTDLFVDLQSISDPTANIFHPDRLRVAKSLPGLTAEALADSISFQIRIQEAFARAFIDQDANDDGINSNDRTDSAGNALGAPTDSTRVIIALEGVPGGVSEVVWPDTSTAYPGTGALLRLVDSTSSPGTFRATYSFEAIDQAGGSDLVMESFLISPSFLFGGGACSTDHIAAMVTLGPSAPPVSGCPGISPDHARPRFLESHALMVDLVSPLSAVVGGPAFSLRLRGAGFVAGSIVRWNGVELPATMVSGSQLEAAVSAEMIARAGTAAITVTNPAALGGSISNPASFQITPHALSLFFPRFNGAGRSGSEITGIALVNLSGRTTDLTLTAFDELGVKITGGGITNPAKVTLNASQQLALVENEVFGSGMRETGIAGWMRLDGDIPGVAGCFLNFDSALARVDGADVSSTTLTSFTFPEAGRSAVVNVANPSDDRASIQFQLMQADGSVRASASRSVAPGGALIESVKDLFPDVTVEAADYIRAEASAGLVPYETFGPAPGDSAGLSGQDAGASYATLYAPQYVAGGPDWQSALTVINLDADPGTVRFRFVANDGTQIGSTRNLPIAGRGKILVDSRDFFLNAGAAMTQGYVEVAGAGIRLGGSVAFASATPGRFLTSLPLAPAKPARMIFSQVASDDNFYTGLAIVNPESTPIRASINVYDRNGTWLAGKVEDLPAQGRVSKLLTEFFPELAGRKISSGYFVVEAARNLAAYAVFGTRNHTSLSAISPQIY